MITTTTAKSNEKSWCSLFEKTIPTIGLMIVKAISSTIAATIRGVNALCTLLIRPESEMSVISMPPIAIDGKIASLVPPSCDAASTPISSTAGASTRNDFLRSNLYVTSPTKTFDT